MKTETAIYLLEKWRKEQANLRSWVIRSAMPGDGDARIRIEIEDDSVAGNNPPSRDMAIAALSLLVTLEANGV